MKHKISVALTQRDIEWATERARQFGVSVSAVVSEAMERYRMQCGWAELLTEIGTEDITKADMAEMSAELRAAGLSV